MHRLAFFSVLFLVLYSGCAVNGSKEKKDKSVADHHTEYELRESLDKFHEYFSNTVTDASEEIDRLSESALPNRNSLKLRSVSIKACSAMLRQEDSITALVDGWVLTTRLRMYFQDGSGSKTFEPNQKVVVDAFNKIEDRIEAIGLEYLNKEHFEFTRNKVHEFAKDYPIKAGMKETVIFASEAHEDGDNPFEEIITLPLLPLMAVNGVTEGVTGTGKIAVSIDKISDVVEVFPESARWQLLMLLYDIEKLDTVESAVASFKKFSDSSSRIADIGEKLPENLRLEIVEMLKEIEEKSPNIRKTLESVSSTSSNIKDTLKAGEELTKSVNTASREISAAAQSWERAAKATELAIKRLIEYNPPEEERLDIVSYKEFAIEMNKLADKVPTVIDRAEGFAVKVLMRVALLLVVAVGGVYLLIRCRSQKSED